MDRFAGRSLPLIHSMINLRYSGERILPLSETLVASHNCQYSVEQRTSAIPTLRTCRIAV